MADSGKKKKPFDRGAGGGKKNLFQMNETRKLENAGLCN